MCRMRTLMLSRGLNADISEGYAEIQRRVTEEHARNQVLSSERDALAEKVKTLEGQVTGLVAERDTLQEEVEEGKNARVILQDDIQAERDLSCALGLSAWEAMKSLEDGLTQLGAVLPARCHRPAEIDITLQRLQRGCEV